MAKVLLITGKGEGQNLFSLKSRLKQEGHKVEILLTLEALDRMLACGGFDFGVVISAKEPSMESGQATATFERALMALDACRARQPKAKLAMVSNIYEAIETAKLVAKTVEFFRSDELDEIAEFCRQ